MRLTCGYGATLPSTAGVLLLVGCGPGATQAVGDGESAPHGYVEGAEETAEPQRRLVMAEAESGAVHILDPATEDVTRVGEVPGAREIATDGRFVYLGTGTDAAVLDSGAWTVDHGDHAHYYRTEADIAGRTEAGSGLGAAGDAAVTALTSDEGSRVLDRIALEEDGEINETASVEGTAVLALGERLLVAGAGGADSVRVVDRDGERAEPELAADCRDPKGQASTRRGAVFGCSDGALVVTEGDDGGFDTTRIPYPASADPVKSFHHRPTAPVVAGVNTGREVWVLDIAGESWTLIDTGVPALAASAAGEEKPVLVLGTDGALRSYDPASGEQLAERDLMEAPDGDTPKPRIWIDTSRAYVNDPEGRTLHEIDYSDDLRIAREFDLDFGPDLMVETGW